LPKIPPAKHPLAIYKYPGYVGNSPGGKLRKGPWTKGLHAMQGFPSRLIVRMADRPRDKSWIVFFNRPQLESQLVVAANAIVVGDHLIFTNVKGDLVALFLLEVVAN
jgi:hypothetical protein